MGEELAEQDYTISRETWDTAIERQQELDEENQRLRSFVDALETDFVVTINKTPRQITELLMEVESALDACGGEYDQDNVILLPWDVARDLLTIADMLWTKASPLNIAAPAPSGPAARRDPTDPTDAREG